MHYPITIETPLGAAVTLRLPTMTSAGYLWKVSACQGAEVEQTIIPPTDAGDRFGEPVETQFTLTREASKAEIILVYHRPWQDKRPLETLALILVEPRATKI